MRYWNLTPMRHELKGPILDGLALSAARNTADALNEILEKMTRVDLGIARRFLTWASKHKVALKPDTLDTRFYEYVRKVPPCSEEDAAKIWRAVNPNTPGEVLRDLVLHPDAEIYCYVACNWSTPVDVLKLLSEHENEEVRRQVAMNPNTGPEILARLAHDKDDRVRNEVAENDSTGFDVLAELAGDSSWVARASVAEHPSVNSHILARLANDRHEFVRLRVARNPSTPAAALAQLASYSESNLREAATTNPGPPPAVQKTLGDLLHEYEVAKQALLEYLDRNHPSGEIVKPPCVEGTILSTSINDEDDPMLSIETSGRLVDVNRLKLDDDPSEKPPMARDRSNKK
jgi:hypothetical protein